MPLCKVVDFAYGDVDGSFPNILFRVLECNHRQRSPDGVVYDDCEERVHCEKCKQELETMNLRDQFPGFRPNLICFNSSNEEWLEVISYPYCEDDDQDTVFVKARKPNKPVSVQTYRISGNNPDLCGVYAICNCREEHFFPMCNEVFRSIDCPNCGSSYCLGKNNEWKGDNVLQTSFLVLKKSQ